MFALVSCNKFLDTMPDNRAELNSADKVRSILVSAYPNNSDYVMTEMASDNAMDNSAKFTIEDKAQEESYLWQDITSTNNDSPKSYFDACYGAVAAANQALDAIEKLGNTKDLQAQKGEALMCRAYGHFLLANLFCLPYNPETADKDLGMPYSFAPETQVKPKYTRGTMKTLYENINADIEAALPLINDEIYKIPKYHFNKKAAYAFAARFNLYYHNYDKVIEYANVVLGDVPSKMLRDWASIRNSASNWGLRVDMYISANEPANLLLSTVSSSWGYWGGPYNLGKRYGHAKPIFTTESVRTSGLWGTYSVLYPASSVWGYDEKLVVTKIGGYFEYTDKVNGIGYRRNVNVRFSTNETLLCRAEAYALKKDYDKAAADISLWIRANSSVNKEFTKDDIVNFYSKINDMPTIVTNDNQRTVRKKINPRGFIVEDGDQLNIIQCILHLRRIETVHEGLRWQDIKRYGIEIAHNRDGLEPDVLKVDDPRRAFQLPLDVIDAGLEPNPR